ncbi:hypothetical protein RvY_16927 [Ramazzottius varieornatus]|uniref:Uncharacterized protein n=1 Tax=Ramazzottius varieornatus TaxID=947166 RepID=A0A1D1W7H8_RAMVA|nr:hypothetical protein RvY_16927 [Ramazzottius varieornatus]
MAAEEVNSLYRNRLRFDLVVLTHPDILSCESSTSNVVDQATEFYYRDQHAGKNVLVSISPGNK